MGALRLVGWLVLAALAPGAAHLKAGWRRTGLTLLSVYAAALLGLLALWLTTDLGSLAGVLVDDTSLVLGTFAAGLLGIAWFTLIVHSFTVLRPGLLRQAEQIVTGALAGLLAVAVLTPFALVTQYAWTGRETINHIFKNPGTDPQADGDRPVPAEDPWAGRERVNILLLGGDADDHRPGVRTDSMHLASVDVKTGNTVLFSLPRNLENVRFKPGTPMAERFPDGFRLPADAAGGRSDLLNSVWEYSDAHPEIFGGKRDQGPGVLMETIGHTLGLEVDWYALVNMWGFARLIDAIGGVTITVEQDVVFGKYNEGLVKAGTRRLKGADAMWYARSRTNSDDYTRMGRQRCVISALLHQADPATVLSRFTAIAGATEDLVETDIPRDMLTHLVPLALKAQDAKATSVQFVPPLIKTYDPDWREIRKLVRKALRESTGAAPVAASATPEASSEATPEATPDATPEATSAATLAATATPSPSKTPKKTADPDESSATDLSAGCGKA
ncbi:MULTISPECIES: LCP family protein [Nonomuraea]|uniref:LCP family protein n=1 Tax=Nonomuraea ferruginea TaxID=46174 RepID=A0ABT4T8B0_9ACTN|nr:MULTISPECIES: LCP family protein [Nonomuraea]MDA0645670.1 LCP family protein [Nonomuraea ferruginea]